MEEPDMEEINGNNTLEVDGNWIVTQIIKYWLKKQDVMLVGPREDETGYKITPCVGDYLKGLHWNGQQRQITATTNHILSIQFIFVVVHLVSKTYIKCTLSGNCKNQKWSRKHLINTIIITKIYLIFYIH